MQVEKPTQIYIEAGPVTTLTLEDDKGLNLLNGQTIRELQQILLALKKEDSLEVLIITGQGQKSFCAGADMRELLTLAQDVPHYVELGQALMEEIVHFPVPVIAAINGYALGAGFSLALACELRVMSVRAKIGQLAVRNGLTPPFGNIQHLLQAIGPVKTKELIYTGRVFTAREALDFGLVNQIVPAEQLLSTAQALAAEICLSPSYVIRRVKKVMNRTLEEGFAVGYLAQEEALVQSLLDERSRAILEGFLTNKNRQA